MSQEIQKTTDYGIFQSHDLNREIRESHVKRLEESIRKKNLLAFRPITVNSEMKVINGQHRLAAAQRLGVPIYYKIQDDITAQDMALLDANVSTWKPLDFLNFYADNGNINYIILRAKLKQIGLPLKVAINLLNKRSGDGYKMFKNGDYVYVNEGIFEYAPLILETIELLKLHISSSSRQHFHTAKFWRALVQIMSKKGFNEKQWLEQVERFANRFTPKTSIEEYFENFVDIYNWKKRINTVSGEKEEKRLLA